MVLRLIATALCCAALFASSALAVFAAPESKERNTGKQSATPLQGIVDLIKPAPKADKGGVSKSAPAADQADVNTPPPAGERGEKGSSEKLPNDFEQTVKRDFANVREPGLSYETYLDQRKSDYFAEIALKRNPDLADGPAERSGKSMQSGTVTICGNGDFEPGIDSTQWLACSGTIVNGGTYFSSGGIQSGALTLSTSHQTLVGPSGYDQTLGGTHLPLVPPGGSLHSVRIGNSANGKGCEALIKDFIVSAGETQVNFSYAVVLEDPGSSHPDAGKPYFGVRVRKWNPFASPNAHWVPTGTPVNFGGGSYNKLVADHTNPFFQTAQSGAVVYRNWSCATIDLSGLVGERVRIEFIAADCQFGQHFGYAYLDNVCGACNDPSAGSLALDASSSTSCGVGKLCFNYTLPKNPTTGHTGTASLTLVILQNGVQVGTLTSGTLSSGTSYCFAINPAAIPGLSNSATGFDYVAKATFALGSYVPLPKQVGTTPDGQVAGANNDYLTNCAQHWCCPGTNLLVNGDFESGAVGNSRPPFWPGIGSAYPSSGSSGPDGVKPGHYSVVTGSQAQVICPNWQVADHFTCDANSGHVMVINGRTNQPSGSSSIWRQTVSVKPGSEYRFCANAKSLPQCCFNVSPQVTVDITGPGNVTLGSIPLTTLVVRGSEPCSWHLLSKSFTVPAGVTSVTIDIRLDETGIGDGNDLALDDISLQEKTQVIADYTAVSLLTSSPVNGNYNVTAFYPPTLPGFPYGYVWQVCEVDASGNIVPGTTVANPSAWWTYTGPTPAGQFNKFTGYNGTATLGSISNAGVFSTSKRYRITFGAWSDCEGLRVSTWTMNFLQGQLKPHIEHGTLPANQLNLPLPTLPVRGSRDFAPTVGTRPALASFDGGARSAVSTDEDLSSSRIAVAQPTIRAGQLAPDFDATDDQGKTWRLSELKGKRNLLLTFFPKCFTGACANHLSSLRDQHDAFESTSTQILAVSVNPAEGERGQVAFAKLWQLTFPLISDTSRKLSMLYGAVQADNELAARMSVLIDKQGVVRYVDTNVNMANNGAEMIRRIHEFGMDH
jgi:peroxiredoxin